MVAGCLEELKCINNEQGQILVQSWHIYSMLQNVKLYKSVQTDIHDVTKIHMAQMSVYQFLLNGESFITWTPDCMEE